MLSCCSKHRRFSAEASQEPTQVILISRTNKATEDCQISPTQPPISLEDEENVPKVEVTRATLHESNGNERSDVLTSVTVEGTQDLPPPPTYDQALKLK